MGSIDFSSYIDLTLDDKDASEIYTEAVDYARNVLPEFNPRPGTLEDAMLQSFSYIGSQAIGAINRLPDGIMEGILRLHGLERLEATFATVTAEFGLSAAGGTVLAGTVVVFEKEDADSTQQYPFTVDSTVTDDDEDTTVTAQLTSTIAGTLPTMTIGTQLLIAEPSSTILTCESLTSLVQGEQSETSGEFLSRGTTYLQSLSRVLATSQQVENYILTKYLDVKRCRVYDLAKGVLFDATTSNVSRSGNNVTVATGATFASESSADTIFRVIAPDYFGSASPNIKSGTYTSTMSGNNVLFSDTLNLSGSGGPADVLNLSKLDLFYLTTDPRPGHFAIFLCGQDGQALSQELKDSIYDDIAERITAGLSFNIFDVWVYDLNLTISIAVDPTFVADDVATSVLETIETAIAPDNWVNWDTVVRVFDVVVAASKVIGVNYVYSVSGTIPVYPNSDYGNEILIEEDLDNFQLVGYLPRYAGLLPRVAVTVTVA